MAPQKILGNPNSQNNNDPFTDLPDSIIHRIFSFLDKNNVVSMRAVSKRFLQVCITCSYLSFIPKPCNQYSPSKEKCKQFREFLDRFWIDRSSKDDAASIDRSGLHIEWTCNVCKFKDKASVVTAWIQEAVKFNFQELHLKMGLSDILRISNCESLRVLNIAGGHVSFPRVVFHSLQVLSIKGPCYVNDCNDDDKKISIGEWISNSCPSLKKLSLEQFTNGNLIMTSLSLEELTVTLAKYGRVSGYNINISMEKLKTLSLGFPMPYYDDASRNNNIVRIIAPNLHDFTFKAGFGRCDFLGEFTYLYKASIDVPADCNYLVALHQSISPATSLQINLLALETLFKNDRCNKQLLIENLHHLILKAETPQNSMWGMGMSSNDEYIPSIISFLKLLLNIKSLTIKRPWERHDSQVEFDTCSPLDKSITDMKHNEPESLMQFQSLKEVVIELRTGTKEIELIKYLLKYAQGLEKVTIFYANNFFHILAEIDIQNFEIASTSLELIFLQKEFDKEEEEDDYSQFFFG